jgi:Ulp1 family protease
LLAYTELYAPVNLRNTHWGLVHIDLVRKIISYYDSWTVSRFYEESATFFLNSALRWLQCESLNKEGVELNVADWTLVSGDKLEVPQQGNSYDCGVCTVMNAIFVSKGLPLLYDDTYLPLFRLSIAVSLATTCLCCD